MIGETIKEMYIKGDDMYPDDYPVIQIDKHYYLIDLGGFDVLANPDLTSYKEYSLTGYKGFHNTDVHGAMIIAFYSNGEETCIVLADNRIISLALSEYDLELLVQECEKADVEWFESSEARDVYFQKLVREQPRWRELY